MDELAGHLYFILKWQANSYYHGIHKRSCVLKEFAYTAPFL